MTYEDQAIENIKKEITWKRKIFSRSDDGMIILYPDSIIPGACSQDITPFGLTVEEFPRIVFNNPTSKTITFMDNIGYLGRHVRIKDLHGIYVLTEGQISGNYKKVTYISSVSKIGD